MRSLATLALALALASAALAEEPAGTLEPVLKEQIATDQAATASQSRVNELSEETRMALLQYRQYLEETKSLEKYAAQLGTQVKSQDEELAFTLASRGVVTRDDLADLATDELTDIEGVDEDRAKALIMEARKHWFE